MAEIYLTPEQVAERLQLSPITIRRQLKRGVLRGIKKGRVWRVPESAVSEGVIAKANDQNRWQQDAERIAAIYEKSLADGDELTAISTASGDFLDVAKARPEDSP